MTEIGIMDPGDAPTPNRRPTVHDWAVVADALREGKVVSVPIPPGRTRAQMQGSIVWHLRKTHGVLATSWTKNNIIYLKLRQPDSTR